MDMSVQIEKFQVESAFYRNLKQRGEEKNMAIDLSGNTETLYLVCDTSGSMAEEGKSLLMRGVARAVEQYFRFGYGAADLKLVLLNTVARIVEWNPDDEFPDDLLQCGGSASVAALNDFSKKINGKILLLTDGWLTNNENSTSKKWSLRFLSATHRIIKIGTDSNPSLKGDGVFWPDDIFTALDDWQPLADAAVDNNTASDNNRGTDK